MNPKVTITFPSSDELDSVRAAMRALTVDKVYGALFEFDQNLRSIHKYGDIPLGLLKEFEETDVTESPKEMSEAERRQRDYKRGVEDMAFHARQLLAEVMAQHGINKEELYS